VAVLPDFTKSHLVAEPLVRLNERGEPEAWLARTWQRDAESKRWRFTLRTRVTFHDGSPLTPAVVAEIVAAALKLKCTGTPTTVVIESDRPVLDLLYRLARTPIARGEIGTGPFKVASKTSLAAFEEYWKGRPFVDTVEFAVGRGTTADVIELPVNVSRRSLPEKLRLWTSTPRDLIAIMMPTAPPATREALASSIDRTAIVNVITQRRGEAAFGFLPQWLTGYEFLFRGPVAPSKAQSPPLVLSVAPGDAVLRLIADRIAVNARDAGLMITVSAQASALKLVRERIGSNDPAQAWAEIAEALGLADAGGGALEALYQSERSALEDRKVVPIVFLPDLYGVAPRVRGWDSAQRSRDGLLHLEDLWVEP
jgi:MarR-like DNA-binding transcriptional regulator SgrR of sgrS sRNA